MPKISGIKKVRCKIIARQKKGILNMSENNGLGETFNFSGGGALCGIVLWFFLCWGMGGHVACIDTKSCGRGDFVLMSICAIAFISPAWFFGALMSDMFPSRHKRRKLRDERKSDFFKYE